MEHKFIYTIQAIIITVNGDRFTYEKDFSSSIEIDNNSYNIPWEITDIGVKELLNEDLKQFLNSKDSQLDINDCHIEYNVTTDDPYVDIKFAKEEDNKLNTSPNITATISPQEQYLSYPRNFRGEYKDNNIYWTWETVKNCAYIIYDNNFDIIDTIGVNKDLYIETNIKQGTNYTRCIVSYDIEMESEPSPFFTVTIPEKKETISIIDNLYGYKVNDPFVTDKEKVEQNIERLEAFKSGIGDNLDLLVRNTSYYRAKEVFDFNVYFKGIQTVLEKKAKEVKLNFKTYAFGYIKKSLGIQTDTQLRFTAYPYTKLYGSIKFYIYLPFKVDIEYTITVKFKNPTKGEVVKYAIYEDTIEINEPIVEKFIVDFKEYLSQYDEVQIDPNFEILNISETIITSPYVTGTIKDEKLYLTSTESENFYTYNKYIDTPLFPDENGEMLLLDKNDIILTNVDEDSYSQDSKDIKVDIDINSSFYTDIKLYDDKKNIIDKNYKPTKDKFDIICSTEALNTEHIEEVKFDINKPCKVYNIKSSLDINNNDKYMYVVEDINKKDEIDVYNGYKKDNRFYIYNENKVKIYGKNKIEKIQTPRNYSWSKELIINENGVYRPITIQLSRIGFSDANGIVEDIVYGCEIEVIDSDIDLNDILIDIENGFGNNQTYVAEDKVTLSTNITDEEHVTKPWIGYSFTSNTYVIEGTNIMDINENILNPYVEGLSDITIMVTSNNPNVDVSCEFENQRVFLDTKNTILKWNFKAEIIMTGQNAWTPLIHSGTYFINQDEYCLYSNKIPSGQYGNTAVNKVGKFMATLNADVEIRQKEKDFERLLVTNNQLMYGKDMPYVEIDQKNTWEGYDVDITDDGIIKLKTEDGRMVIQGRFTSPWLTFDYTLSRIRLMYDVIWDKDGHFGTVEAQMQYKGTIRPNVTDFFPIENNKFYIPDDNIVAFRIQYLINKEIQLKPLKHTISYKSNKSLDLEKSINIQVTDNKLTLYNKQQSGSYISDIIKIDTDKYRYLNLNIFANHSLTYEYNYTIYIQLSDSIDEIQKKEASWTRIDNMSKNFEARNYMRYKIVIPYESKIEIYSFNINLYNDRYEYDYAPAIRNTRITGVPYEFVKKENIKKIFAYDLIMDGYYHEVTDLEIKDMIQTELINTGYVDYKINDIAIDNPYEFIRLTYDRKGNGKLLAKTDKKYKHVVNNKYISVFTDDEMGIGYLTPIPVASKPVIVYKENYGYLKQVSFIDENNNPTLTNTEYIHTDGRNVIALGYKDIDISTIKVTLDDKILSFDHVIDNYIYFLDNLEPNKLVKVTYKIMDSFNIDYNFITNIDKRDDTAKISIFLKTGVYDYDKIVVCYETSEKDEWFDAYNIELNPIYNPDNQGFVFLDDYERVPTHVEVKYSKEPLICYTNETRYIYIRVLDKNNNPVGNVPLNINILHGTIEMKTHISNQYGIVSIKYTVPSEDRMDIDTNDWTEILTIYSYKEDIKTKQYIYRIYHEELIPLYRPTALVNIVATTEQLDVNVEEDIIIKVKVFTDDLKVCNEDKVTISNNVKEQSKNTDANGMVEFSIKAVDNTLNGYCKLSIRCRYKYEYINIKLKDNIKAEIAKKDD